MSSPAPIPLHGAVDAEQDRLDRVFFALSDPVRRAILERLDGEALLVSELAEPFAISLQAVSAPYPGSGARRPDHPGPHRPHQPLRCSLEAEPLSQAAGWINRYAKYWQAQFETLAKHLLEIERKKP